MDQPVCIGWGRIDVGQISFQLYEAWQSSFHVDFTLFCDGLSIPCHRIVLSARSDFFRGLLRWVPTAQLPTFEHTFEHIAGALITVQYGVGRGKQGLLCGSRS